VEKLLSTSRSVWLPYWHIVKEPSGKETKKYGQWAPFLGIETYSELAQKAIDARLLQIGTNNIGIIKA